MNSVHKNTSVAKTTGGMRATFHGSTILLESVLLSLSVKASTHQQMKGSL